MTPVQRPTSQNPIRHIPAIEALKQSQPKSSWLFLVRGKKVSQKQAVIEARIERDVHECDVSPRLHFCAQLFVHVIVRNRRSSNRHRPAGGGA